MIGSELFIYNFLPPQNWPLVSCSSTSQMKLSLESNCILPNYAAQRPEPDLKKPPMTVLRRWCLSEDLHSNQYLLSSVSICLSLSLALSLSYIFGPQTAVFNDHSCWVSGVHMRCQGLNRGWLLARQAPYVCYFLSWKFFYFLIPKIQLLFSLQLLYMEHGWGFCLVCFCFMFVCFVWGAHLALTRGYFWFYTQGKS